MEQNPGGSAPQITDSTSNADNATANGGMTSANSVTGEIGKGLTFNGSSNYLSTTWPLGGSTTFTASGWIKPVTGYYLDMLEQRNPSYTGWAIYTDLTLSPPSARFYTYPANVSVAGTTNIYDGAWHHVEGIANGGTMTLYIDGVAQGTPQSMIGVGNSTLYIESDCVGNPYPGLVDEVRISNTARSAAWVEFEYHNIADPAGTPTGDTGNDLIIGPEQTPPPGASC
jgi:hypothetical protein